MATKFTTSAIHPKPLLSGHKHHRSSPFLNPNSSPHRHHHHHHLRLTVGVAASASPSSESSSGGFNSGSTDTENNEEEDSTSFSESFISTRAQLDLLEQLTSSTPTSNPGSSNSSTRGIGISIRDQLQKLVPDRDDDFSVPLGKNLKKFTQKFLTTSQKRNIKRQTYLNEVSKRNDSVFFATVGAFVLVPPLLILGIAVITGYVQLFP